MILTEFDVERGPAQAGGCGCKIDILYLPCKYRGDTWEETANNIRRFNADLWLAVSFAMGVSEGVIEFY